MKLIGAGLPRTGTLSQKAAMEILGMDPCHHMVSVFMDLEESKLWKQAFEGSLTPDKILDAYPAAEERTAYAREIAAKYTLPGAVLLPVTIPMVVERGPAQAAYDEATDVILGHLAEGRDAAESINSALSGN